MPLFEVEHNGEVYEVDAPDEMAAASAFAPAPAPSSGPRTRGGINSPGRRAAAETDAANAQIAAGHQEPGVGERALRYMGDWGQNMRDAFTAPAGGPTGIPLVDSAAGAADAALSIGSGVVGTIPALAETAFRGARGDPGASYSEALDRFTYEPRTQTGQAMLGAAGAVMQPLADAAQSGFGRLSQVTDDPTLQRFIQEAGPDVAGAVLEFGAGAAATRLARQGMPAPRPNPTPGGEPLRPFGPGVERARRLDYRLTPSQVSAQAQMNAPVGEFGTPVPGMIRESFTTPDFHTKAIIDNQKRTNTFVARELGLPDGTVIDQAALDAARMPHNAVYDEVPRSLPTLMRDPEMESAAQAIGQARRTNPYLQNSPGVESVRERLLSASTVSTQDALTAIREFRHDANTWFKRAATGDVDAEQVAFAYRQAADAIESAIERQAGVLDPTLVPRLREARTNLAKIHNVEAALDGTNIDPQQLAKLAEKYPLSGYLGEIAAVARDFPDTMRSATGLDMPIQTQQGALNSVSLAARRLAGHAQGPRLLRDEFQQRFGSADPNYRPGIAESSPFPPPAAPPSPDLPFEPTPNVMPPAPGGGPALTATDLGAQFDELPPAEAFPGDLTASPPPAQGGVPFAPSDLGLADLLAGDAGLDVPPSRFAGGEDTLPFDLGLEFAPDPDMAAAPIVRGGGDPRTVQDTLLSDELMTRPDENLGRPLDFDTADRLAPLDEDMVTRPAPGLGDEFDLVPDPRTDVVPYVAEGEFIQGSPPRRPRPGKWDNAEDAIGPDQLPAPDAPLGEAIGPRSLPPPQRRLPAPDAPAETIRTPDGYTFYKVGDQWVDSLDPDSVDITMSNADMVREFPDAFPGNELAGRQIGDELDLDSFANWDAPPDNVVDLAAQMERLTSQKARPLDEIMADEALEENTIAAREARDAGVAGPRSLADEITNDETPAAPKGGRMRATVIEDPYQIPDEMHTVGTVFLHEGDATNPLRSMALEPSSDGKTLTIRATHVRGSEQAKGYGQQNYVDAAQYAADRGMTLNGDVSLTKAAWRSLKRALDKGLIEADDVPVKAIEAAFERDPGVAKNPRGDSWVKGIRVGPTG